MSGSLQKVSASSIQSAFSSQASNIARKEKQRRPAPLSLRLSSAQRAKLEQLAGGRPLGGYIKDQLFRGGEKTKSFHERSGQCENRKLLAQILRALGSADIIKTIGDLRTADDIHALILSDEANLAIHQACRDVATMRRDLIVALGLKAGGSP